MNSIYPEALDGYSQLPLIIDGSTGIDSKNINAIRSAIISIETELGIVPSGASNTVAERLDSIDKKFHGPLSSAPTNVIPSNGDMYFDTTISSSMYWDEDRDSWLSTETYSFTFSKDGVVLKGGYFKAPNGISMSSSMGELALFDGMITNISLSREAPISESSAIDYSVLKDGDAFSSLTLSGTISSGFSSNSDTFDEGQILSVGISPESSNKSTSGTVGRVYYKWRR
jgi:hypothetical protein